MSVLALLLAVGLTSAMDHGALGMFTWDEAEYASIGWSLTRGEGFAIGGEPNRLRPPLLPLSVAASIGLAGGPSDPVARAPMLLYAVLGLWVVYGCVGRATDRVTGLTASLLLASTPLYRELAPLLLTEVPFICTFTAAVLLFHLGVEERPGWFVGAWTCFGLALLTRYNALFFGPIVAVYLLFAFFMNRRKTMAAIRSRHFWLAPVAAVVVLAPWLLRQHISFGDPLIGFRMASVQLPSYTAELQPANFYLMALPVMLSWPVVLLFLLGIWTTFDKADRVGILSLVAAGAIILLLTPFAHKQTRLVSSTLPFLATVAALGLRHVIMPPLKRLTGARIAWPAVAVGWVILFAVNARATSSTFERNVTLGYPSFVEAMAHLEASSGADETVVSPNPPQVFWYGRRRSSLYPADAGGLRDLLPGTAWGVVTNFERGQPAYVYALLERAEALEDTGGDLIVFESPPFTTVLVRTGLLLRALDTPGSAAPVVSISPAAVRPKR